MERTQPGTTPAQEASAPVARIFEMQRLIDVRDETIRRLNEALSLALDELDRTSTAA